ncbi:MAG: nicotinate (nicotinamide) nucleotide adenylyltransferase [Deltaproteobacteria bacterium]|nr:nicotinate (nicotinamide) nucleotide adenylyltransferase [Deltaproteobacteria bacterium]
MMAARRPRHGLFGGTFNPVHVAHLRAAEEVAEALEIERMVFVPSASPPHKSGDASGPIAPPELRLAWLLEAAADNPRFGVDPTEIERGGVSYSVDTVRDMAARVAPERPIFVIGWDAFIEIDSWKDPATLFTLADFAVMTRPPVSDASLASFLPSCIRAEARVAPDGSSAEHGSDGAWIRLVPVTPLDVSASDIRRRLREGRSVRYLLPDRVHDAIVASGLYGPQPPSRGATPDADPASDTPEDR